MLRRFAARFQDVSKTLQALFQAFNPACNYYRLVKPTRTNNAMDLPASMKNDAIHNEMDVSIFNLHQKKNIHVSMNEEIKQVSLEYIK